MVLLEAFSLIIYGMLIEKPAPSCMHLNVLTHLIRVSRNCRALGVVWTSPLVAALGSSLTIPLAMIEDVLIHGQHYSVFYILGSTQVNEVYHYCGTLRLWIRNLFYYIQG
jgi:hypothetical protein